jgi:uncharacterized protein YndB with AHSA1/START domain
MPRHMESRTDIRIEAPAERVFAILIALDRYGEWLPPSDVFRGLDVQGDGPIQKGTTYVDRQAAGINMTGEVCVCDEPNVIAFRQVAKLPFGTVHARVEFRMDADDGATRVVRHHVIALPWLLWPLTPIAKAKQRTEAKRILESLRHAVETQQAAGA